MSYVLFNPPRRVEEYPDRLPMNIVEEMAAARLAKQPPKYLVKGEWHYPDGRRFLDFAVNREWVDAVTNYKINDGRLRWTCPVCAKVGGGHTKGCDYE